MRKFGSRCGEDLTKMRTYVRINQMVIAALIPAFELKVAAGGSSALLGEPLALAPIDAVDQRIGQVSKAAEGQGVAAGMPLGEALSRCPRLKLIPADPLGSAAAWELVLRGIEGIGAAVASPTPGLALFDADGLLRLHRGLEGLITQTRRSVSETLRIGAAESVFAARTAAALARVRQAKVVTGGEDGAGSFLAPLPVAALRQVESAGRLVPVLERLGISTLGQLAQLPIAKLADRFGSDGIEARELACGRGPRLRPRDVPLQLNESIEIPEPADGRQLGHALELLIGRLLAGAEREGRTLRSVELQASLEGGGTWLRAACFREALDSRLRIGLALKPLLDGIPAPVARLGLLVTAFGPPAVGRQSLIKEAQELKLERLREAIQQTRTAGGPLSALRVVEVEPDSRLPERRMALTPFEI